MAEIRQGWSYSGDIGVHICRIDLQNFRNFDKFHHSFDSSCVLLTGANGVGKTNILEAISLLSPGRGLRGAKAADFVNFAREDSSPSPFSPPSPWGCGFGLVFPKNKLVGDKLGGEGREASGENGEGLRISLSGDEKGGHIKNVRVDGNIMRRQEDLLDYVRVVWLLPQMERLFFDGPKARRDFLDDLTCGFDLSHRQRCSDYKNLLRQRFRLLRDGGGGNGGEGEGGGEGWLSALESQMAELGVAITAARFDSVRRLNGMCRYGDKRFPYSELRLSGLLEEWVAGDSAVVAEDRLRCHLRDNRESDRMSGVSSVGPNCSQVIIYLRRFGMDGGILAEHCSAGECRALLVSMVISQAYLIAVESGIVPILLLDEVCVYLDHVMRGILFDVICGYPGQCWLTATDAGLFGYFGGSLQEVGIG